MATLVILYFGLGLLMAAISIPLILRRIKPNPWYGFRVPKSFRNEEIWYEINAYSGIRLLIAGLVFSAAALLLPLLFTFSVDGYAIAMSLFVTLLLAVTLIQSFRYLNSIAK